MQKTIDAVEKWAAEKNLLDKKNSFQQFAKVVEEVGEIAAALCKKRPKRELQDSIGDVIVTLIILSRQNGLTLESCLQEAYYEIANRRGKTVDGVFIKEEE